MITNKHIELLTEKYGKLFYTVAMKVGLDPILHDKEDCVQDLTILAYQTLKRFKKDKTPELSIEEIIESSYFDKYLKTCLWNYKNQSGTKISGRVSKLKQHSLYYENNDNEEGTVEIPAMITYNYSYFDFDEFTARMGDVARESLREIMNARDEDSFLGLRPLVAKACGRCGVPVSKANDMVYGLKEEVKRALGDSK
jgi:hypothetical protein